MTATATTQTAMMTLISTTVRPLDVADDKYTSVHTHVHTYTHISIYTDTYTNTHRAVYASIHTADQFDSYGEDLDSPSSLSPLDKDELIIPPDGRALGTECIPMIKAGAVTLKMTIQ